jgi:hypothetical protein
MANFHKMRGGTAPHYYAYADESTQGDTPIPKGHTALGELIGAIEEVYNYRTMTNRYIFSAFRTGEFGGNRKFDTLEDAEVFVSSLIELRK